MRIISSTVPAEAERSTATRPQPIISNGKTRSRILGDRLPLLHVMASCAFLVGVLPSDVSGQALRSTEAAQTTSDIGMAPPLVTAAVQVPAAVISEAPTQPVPTPPTPGQPTGQVLQFQQVIYSLRANNYTIGAGYISEYLFLLPLGSTLFVPTNAAFDGVNVSAALGPLLAYHAVMQQLTDAQITLLAVGAQFATMAANNTVVVTSAVADNFRVDDVRVVPGDVCTSIIWAMQISCYGVNGVLNMTAWGNVSLAQVTSGKSPPGTASPSSFAAPRAGDLYTTFLAVVLYYLLAAASAV